MLYARRHREEGRLPPALPPADESATRAERSLHIQVDLDYSLGSTRGSLDYSLSPNSGLAVCDSGWRVTRQGSAGEDAMARHLGSPAWRCLSTPSPVSFDTSPPSPPVPRCRMLRPPLPPPALTAARAPQPALLLRPPVPHGRHRRGG
jgi:hypothetical protein